MNRNGVIGCLLLAACSNTQNMEGPGTFMLDAAMPDMDMGMPPPPPPMDQKVVINEVSSEADFIELINLGAPISLDGWRVADDAYDAATGEPADHIAPVGTAMLAQGERLLIDGLPFGLGGSDGVRLFDAEGRIVDAISWAEGDAMPAGCRIPDGTGDWVICEATPDALNMPLEDPGPEPGPAVEPDCGDGLIGPDELCDGEAHAGRTCEDFGLRSGTLRCAPGCQGFDLDGCLPADVEVSVVLNEISSAGDDFIELRNLSDMPASVGGWAVADSGFDVADPETADARHVLAADAMIPPDGWLVLIKDVDHGFGVGGEDGIRLFNAAGLLVDQTAWMDGEADPAWCRLEDGTGDFAPCAVATPSARNGEGEAECGNARVEAGEVCDGDRVEGTCEDEGFSGGTLGCADDCRSVDTTACVAEIEVVLNEVTSAGDDSIEIFNRGRRAVDLTGWAVTDNGFDPEAPDDTADHRYVLEGMLESGGYRVLIKDTDHPFGIGREDAITLYNADGAVIDQTTWPEDGAATSWCRQPNGEGAFVACDPATFGAAND
jgi:hypothetical protein